ncbi:GGDEF domain-containing protein [bacterium]|nr:GGDEF domain-containing protein [bacterium]
MIRLYTTNQSIIDVVQNVADGKGYQAEILNKLDANELAASVEDLSILVFDLTSATLSTDAVISALDSQDPELLPPVLYILASPADIELVTQMGSIVNQDYIFVPLEPVQLGARFEVLKMLGQRRRLTMETAITDRLTGLYNRKYFLRRLEEELYRSVRYKYSVGVLLAVVDFSTDTGQLTEQTGTEVITQIADYLKGRLRRSDIVARFKWDNFAFLLPDITIEDSKSVAEDVKNKLELLGVSTDGQNVRISVSLGHVLFPVDGLGSAIEVVEALEECTFKAKTGGSGEISYYQSAQRK